MLALASGGCEGCFSVVIVVAVIAGVIAAIVTGSKRAERSRTNVERALMPFAGRLIEASLFGRTGAEFEMDGVAGTMTWHFGSKNNPAFTQVEFNHHAAGLLRVRHEGFLGTIRKLFGATDVQIGDATFDAAFQVEATPESFAREVLAAGAREALLRWSPIVVFDVQRARVLLRVGRVLTTDEAALDAFLETARVLLKSLRPPAERTTGVEIVGMTTSGGECPTCGAALEGAVAECGKCGTRQHADCWEYMGVCATYGCGGAKKRIA
jgi:hypothetical protein